MSGMKVRKRRGRKYGIEIMGKKVTRKAVKFILWKKNRKVFYEQH